MEKKVSHDELLNHLKVLVSESCKAGKIESHLNADGITVNLRFDKGTDGSLDFARRVAALLAQETM
jgi:hypothetical protein